MKGCLLIKEQIILHYPINRIVPPDDRSVFACFPIPVRPLRSKHLDFPLGEHSSMFRFEGTPSVQTNPKNFGSCVCREHLSLLHSAQLPSDIAQLTSRIPDVQNCYDV